jgi:CheY-like chemotaxis protein
MACLCVADTGQGIAPEFLPYVFDRFRQAESAYTRKYSGLGLGLAIVRHIVEMHGGTVEARSEGLGHGARFTVLLPLPTLAEAAETTLIEAASPSVVNTISRQKSEEIIFTDNYRVLAGRRILVVDDQEDTRVLIKSVLSNYEATVEMAASVSEALKKLQDNPSDALISDIGMPGEDGYSLIQKLRSGLIPHSTNIPALAFSAFAREEDKQRALQAGFNDYHAKPISPPILVNALAALLQEFPS